MKPFKGSCRVWALLLLLALGLPGAAQTTKKVPVKKATPSANTAASRKTGARKLPANPAIAARPASVSAATWAKIIALKPGMTRADLMQVFQEEGGIISPSFRTYILRGSKGDGPYVKISATFAPDPSPVDGQNAQGSSKAAAPHKTPSLSGRPGDVITSLGNVRWGYMIMD